MSCSARTGTLPLEEPTSRADHAGAAKQGAPSVGPIAKFILDIWDHSDDADGLLQIEILPFAVKWTSLVLHALNHWPGGKCRTGDLQRALPGISKKMLIQTLPRSSSAALCIGAVTMSYRLRWNMN